MNGTTDSNMTHLHGCRAPAKLNLFLHVVGRRDDGYHLLQSVFQLIDLADVLHFDLRDDETITRVTDIPDVPAVNDLTVRAAQLLADAIAQRGHRPTGVNIAIEKHIPMGGGLGGGSSDAATTLLALNQLWRGGMKPSELMALGLQLGADVPFFLLGENAFVEGIGEKLTAVPTPSAWFVVIHPGISVPTPLIFREPELTRNSKAVRIADFSASPLGFGRNDLQAVAARAFPPVADAVKWLSGFGEARMTGSGACVFAAFASESEADAVLRSVPGGWRGWKAQSLATHPMVNLLQS
jgi:4-diphosphocytidyl-2-C-methyl-D-erythritol kinase